MNTINFIEPYKIGKSWVFDDERTGLIQEPFVAGADTLLEILSKGKKKIKLLFSETYFPETYKLDWQSEEVGNWYFCKQLNHKLWLCPALLKYFKTAPKTIFFKVEEL